jgi:phosphonoacetate hydrolase
MSAQSPKPAVVCIDGGDPAYLRQVLADGSIPNIARFIRQGFATVADGTVPSFTCPNNMSIITGTPASKHGISGNYYLDTATGAAVVMTGPELLRGDTILAKFAEAGAKVVSVPVNHRPRERGVSKYGMLDRLWVGIVDIFGVMWLKRRFKAGLRVSIE